MPEAMKLCGSTKKLIDRTKLGENVDDYCWVSQCPL